MTFGNYQSSQGFYVLEDAFQNAQWLPNTLDNTEPILLCFSYIDY